MATPTQHAGYTLQLQQTPVDCLTCTTAREPSTSSTCPLLKVPSPSLKLTISAYLGVCREATPMSYAGAANENTAVSPQTAARLPRCMEATAVSAAGDCLSRLPLGCRAATAGRSQHCQTQDLSSSGCCETPEVGAAHLDMVHNDQGPTHTANGAVVCTGRIGSATAVLSHATWHGTSSTCTLNCRVLRHNNLEECHDILT